jgi:hypothetical protein
VASSSASRTLSSGSPRTGACLGALDDVSPDVRLCRRGRSWCGRPAGWCPIQGGGHDPQPNNFRLVEPVPCHPRRSSAPNFCGNRRLRQVFAAFFSGAAARAARLRGRLVHAVATFGRDYISTNNARAWRRGACVRRRRPRSLDDPAARSVWPMAGQRSLSECADGMG